MVKRSIISLSFDSDGKEKHIISINLLSFSRQVSTSDYAHVETVMKKVIKEKQPFERLEMKKEDLLKMFEVC
jgi:threonyl-tRNA synthetase